MISPTETPFISAIGKTRATATLHEWQTDALASAAANAQLEGDSFSASAATASVRVTNYLQISSKSLTVTGTSRRVNTAGRSDEKVYQVMKRGKELRRDMEFVLTNNQAPNAGNTTTARQLRPMLSWYATNVSNGGTGAANGSTSAARTDGSDTSAISEAKLITSLQQAWVAGGNPDMVLCGPFNKRSISAFAGPSGTQKNLDISDKKLFNTVDVYVSDFGTVKIVADRFSRERDIHVLDTDMLALSTLRDIEVVDIAKTGDGDSALILAEYTLEVRNEAANALIADVSTS